MIMSTSSLKSSKSITIKANENNGWLALGRPNRLSAVDRFLDSKCQSRFSDVWWGHIFNEKRFIQGCQLRAILIFTTL
jgi:hypothetical protein